MEMQIVGAILGLLGGMLVGWYGTPINTKDGALMYFGFVVAVIAQHVH